MNLIELLFPRRCPVCDEPVKAGYLICKECKGELRYLKEPLCYRCGKQLREQEQEYCYDCARNRHQYVQGMALYDYPTVKKTIYRFKYGGRCEYANFFAKEIAAHMGKRIREWNPDALIPIPLHPSKQVMRGYNQAAVLACALGKELGIEVCDKLVHRVRKTTPMKDLDVHSRQINLKNAFIISKDDVKLRRVILIDDIYTTGSTVDAVARELHRHGVCEIFYIALAIGVGM